MTLLTLITIFLVSLASQTPPAEQKRVIVTAWNECGASIEKENQLFTDLTKSLQLNPPWRVLDARAPAHRAQLIDEIIREHRRRIKLLEKIREADQ